MDATDLRAAARLGSELLTPTAERNWDIPIPEMDWTVAKVVSHVTETLLWYTVDFAGGSRELGGVQLSVDAGASPDALLHALGTAAEALSRVVDGAPAGSRGWHPFGAADASGFAAMGCDELLVHTDDAARGLGLAHEPDRELCERTLHRLFPWAPTDVDPWQALLWANGRIALPGHPRPTKWRWHCAPLDEWDGEPGYRA